MCGLRDEVDATRIGDDQLRALAQATLHLRGKHRMSVGRVGADDKDHVGLHDRVKILRTGGLTQCLLQTITGGRVADTRAGIDVVVAEAGANQLLDEIGFLVAAAGRGDATDRVAAVLRLDSLAARWRRARWLPPTTLRATDR